MGQPQGLNRPDFAGAPAFPEPPPQARRQQPGPWNCDVDVWRVSPGGQTQKLATFERAGVATVARLKDGRLLAAHQHFPADSEADFDKVAVRFSTDEGRTWTTPRVISLEGLPPGMRFPFDPTLVPLPDGRVRLYFTSVQGRRPDLHHPCIYSAISTNGVDYVMEPGVRFAIEGRPVIDCTVVLHQGTYHLYAPDNGAGIGPGEPAPPRGAERPRPGTGYHATSQDGLSFKRAADVRVGDGRRWLGNAVSDGKEITFFGTGDGPPGRGGGLWQATSPDGFSWSQPVGVPDVPGADPAAVRLQDGTWLVMATSPPRRGLSQRPAGDRYRLPAPGSPRTEEAAGWDGNPLRPPAEKGPFREGGPPSAQDFRRVLVRIPSAAAGRQGVAAEVLFPSRPRYEHGAPVVVQVAGGVLAGSARGVPEFVGDGFVQIHFAFPGGGDGDERSGGTYDFRGPACIRALADVIRFATGRAADADERRITDLAGPLKVLTNNCGIVGSSHGGNACGLVMAKHGHELPGLAWYASMESPYGEGAANVELGGRDSGLNPAYDPESGVLDLRPLAWSPDLSPGLMRKPMPAPAGQLRGAFFFDLNGDGRFSLQDDFPVNCFVGDAGGGVCAWYSPRILAEAEKRRLLPSRRPAHIPSLDDAREFWSWRDAAPSIPAAVSNLPHLAVIVYANERDHVQADPAHTHILEQVEGFRKAGARFVRLNPDRAYVEAIAPSGRAGAGEGSFADNPAGKEFNRQNILSGLEPADVPQGVYMRAAVCELADRVQARNWAPNLEAILYPRAPRGGPFPGGSGARFRERLRFGPDETMPRTTK
jgi:hypothetical protein